MFGFGGWINASWILLLTFFDTTCANYSEDQCSWRGRQVLFLIPVISEHLYNKNLNMSRRDATGV